MANHPATLANDVPAKANAHHRGSYQVRARAIRQQANANPSTRCWRTGLTLTEGQAKWGNHIRWQAGHIRDGDPTSPLAAELSYPNQSEGATFGNRRRVNLVPSRRW